METEIKIFISYLHNTKRMSGNTVVSYERDLRKMMQYFQEAHQITRDWDCKNDNKHRETGVYRGTAFLSETVAEMSDSYKVPPADKIIW